MSNKIKAIDKIIIWALLGIIMLVLIIVMTVLCAVVLAGDWLVVLIMIPGTVFLVAMVLFMIIEYKDIIL